MANAIPHTMLLKRRGSDAALLFSTLQFDVVFRAILFIVVPNYFFMSAYYRSIRIRYWRRRSAERVKH
jgi:hypothetical protein